MTEQGICIDSEGKITVFDPKDINPWSALHALLVSEGWQNDPGTKAAVDEKIRDMKNAAAYFAQQNNFFGQLFGHVLDRPPGQPTQKALENHYRVLQGVARIFAASNTIIPNDDARCSFKAIHTHTLHSPPSAQDRHIAQKYAQSRPYIWLNPLTGQFQMEDVLSGEIFWSGALAGEDLRSVQAAHLTFLRSVPQIAVKGSRAQFTGAARLVKAYQNADGTMNFEDLPTVATSPQFDLSDLGFDTKLPGNSKVVVYAFNEYGVSKLGVKNGMIVGSAVHPLGEEYELPAGGRSPGNDRSLGRLPPYQGSSGLFPHGAYSAAKGRSTPFTPGWNSRRFRASQPLRPRPGQVAHGMSRGPGRRQ